MVSWRQRIRDLESQIEILKKENDDLRRRLLVYENPHTPPSKSKNNAPSGRFGKNVLTHVTLLKYEDGLPLRKTVSSLERHYNISVTDVGILNLTNQVSRKLERPYQEIILRIRNAGVVYADETEIRVNGVTYHLWTFVTDSEVVFVIRKRRD